LSRESGEKTRVWQNYLNLADIYYSMTDKMAGNGIPKRDFTPQDFAEYQQRLKPYQDKVYTEGVLLSEVEVRHLLGIRAEIRDAYNLAQGEIYGEISNLIALDSVRRTALLEDRLVDERGELKSRIHESAPDKRAEIYARLHEIRRILEPEHYR
jgi:hypothetical protein